MNILIVVDKYGTAIDRLAQSVKTHNPHFNIQVLSLHPKRPDALEILKIKEALTWCDLLDVHYWKSGEKIRELFPTEFKEKKKIVCHFNPYDLDKLPFNEIYDEIVVGNKQQHEAMPYARYIPYAIDLDKFTFDTFYTDRKIVNMVVGRIEGKKGVLQVAKACKELGYTLELVGRISKPEYFNEVMKYTPQFYENVPDDELVNYYKRAAIHVCNSVDGFETGTLPILEAMACGVPVVTRSIGHVPELFDGKNMVVRKGKEEDVEDLKAVLKETMENRDVLLRLRENGFQTVKNRNDKKMARQFSQLYYKVLGEKHPLVSVIIPTKDRVDSIVDVLAGIFSQDYPSIEVVLVDSSQNYKSLEELTKILKTQYKTPIKYIHFSSDTYSLAEARNRGIIESEGEILVFCDDRLQMESDAIKQFALSVKQHCWIWGIKDDFMKAFVENFSAVRREDIIQAGMFNERINVYGGMSQEVRTRFTKQGFVFEINMNAKAKSIRRSPDKEKKRREIIDAKLLLYKLYG